jgi:GT2 family glycosyltransferase
MGGYFNPKTGKHGMYGYYDDDADKYKQVRQVDWLTGMGTLIPVNAIRNIGYWDAKNFPQYHGDSDFTYRAKLNGYKILVDPDLIIYNSTKSSGIEHRGSFKKMIRLFTDIRSKSNFKRNLKFYRKYATSIRAYLPFLLLYIRIILGFFKWKFLNFAGIKKNQF